MKRKEKTEHKFDFILPEPRVSPNEAIAAVKSDGNGKLECSPQIVRVDAPSGPYCFTVMGFEIDISEPTVTYL